MASFWQARITEEEKHQLEAWWQRRLAMRKALGPWPPRWPKMEERLPRRQARLEKKYGKR